MKTASLTLYFLAGLVAVLAANSVPKNALYVDTGIEAVDRVFARYPKDKKETWPISGYPRYTPGPTAAAIDVFLAPRIF
jgi:hypothetical protein